MPATFDTAVIEQMLAPMDLGVIPDLRDTDPDEIYKQYERSFDNALEGRNPTEDARTERSEEFGHIDIGLVKRRKHHSEFHDGCASDGEERRLRVAVPKQAIEPDESPVEVVQFVNLFRLRESSLRMAITTDSGEQIPVSPYSRFKSMELSYGVSVPGSILEALGVEVATDDISILHKVGGMESHFTVGNPANDPAYDRFLDLEPYRPLKRAYGAAIAILDRLSST